LKKSQAKEPSKLQRNIPDSRRASGPKFDIRTTCRERHGKTRRPVGGTGTEGLAGPPQRRKKKSRKGGFSKGKGEVEVGKRMGEKAAA